MATNTFITVQEIARAVLPRLYENLVFPNLIHKDLSSDFVTGKGATIQVKKPVVLTATEFAEANGVTAQNVTEQSVTVTLDKIADVSVEFGALQMATNVAELNSLFIEPAAVALAQKINNDGLALYKDVIYTGGAAGTTPDGLDDLTTARKLLNSKNVPLSPRNALWDPEAEAKFLQLATFVEADKAGTTDALRNGSLGRLMGFENYMSQSVPDHKKGTLATAGTTGKYIFLKGAAAAATSVILDSDDSTLTGTLVKGDIITFTLAGVVKNALVTELATAESNEITVKITPALTIGDNAVVTILANHTANLCFHPLAFAYVSRPLEKPAGVESYVVNFNGLSLRVVRSYDSKYKKDMLSMDVLYGYKTLYPELAVRYLG